VERRFSEWDGVREVDFLVDSGLRIQDATVIKILRDNGAIILGKLESQLFDYGMELIYLADRVRSGIVGKANMTEWANFRQVSHTQSKLAFFSSSSSQPERRISTYKTRRRRPTRNYFGSLQLIGPRVWAGKPLHARI
jgi:hypothetical protein